MRILALVAALALAGAPPAFAQAAQPASPGTTSASPAAKPTKAERTAKSRECSQQADAKGLHGKERHKFRSACKRGEQS